MQRSPRQRSGRRSDGITILTAAGRIDGVPANRSEASLAGSYWNAISHFLATGDSRRLEGFSGAMVSGYELLTDLDLVEMYARRGQLDFESIYGSVR